MSRSQSKVLLRSGGMVVGISVASVATSIGWDGLVLDVRCETRGRKLALGCGCRACCYIRIVEYE